MVLSLVAEKAAQRATPDCVAALKSAVAELARAVKEGAAAEAFVRLELHCLKALLHAAHSSRLQILTRDLVFNGPGAAYASMSAATLTRQRDTARAWRQVARQVASGEAQTASQTLHDMYQAGVDEALNVVAAGQKLTRLALVWSEK